VYVFLEAEIEKLFKEDWVEREIDEVASIIYEKQVAKLVPREEWINVLRCKFLYKTKRNVDLSVKRRKVRLVKVNRKMKIHQNNHTVELLAKFEMSQCRPIDSGRTVNVY
jgi:hypothetical protein